MTMLIRNPLTYVWAFLAIITIASWWIGRSGGAAFQINPAVTAGVLLIALIKSRLVIRYFMEVRFAPSWLQRACDAWLLGLLVMITFFYWFSF